MTRAIRAAALLAALTCLAPSARAGLLPVSVTVTPESDYFRWTYAIVLPTDSQLRAGDYFTVYDFAGLVGTGGAVQPDGWSFQVSDNASVPPGVSPQDDPDTPNLTWTYTGPDIPSGQTGLGNFWAVSEFSNPGDSAFTARTHRTADGRIDTNITDTVVPVPVPPTEGVPEPGTLLLAGLGLSAVGVLRRRK